MERIKLKIPKYIKTDYYRRKYVLNEIANRLHCKVYELIIKDLTILNKSTAIVNVDKSKKYLIKEGAKVSVFYLTNYFDTTISEIDFDIEIIKVPETKELPYSFENVKFLETSNIN